MLDILLYIYIYIYIYTLFYSFVWRRTSHFSQERLRPTSLQVRVVARLHLGSGTAARSRNLRVECMTANKPHMVVESHFQRDVFSEYSLGHVHLMNVGLACGDMAEMIEHAKSMPEILELVDP